MKSRRNLDVGLEDATYYNVCLRQSAMAIVFCADLMSRTMFLSIHRRLRIMGSSRLTLEGIGVQISRIRDEIL